MFYFDINLANTQIRYSDVTMGAMASQISSAYATACSGAE